MKKILFAGAAGVLMFGVAMAQPVAPTPTPQVVNPMSPAEPFGSSVLIAGVSGSTWTTGSPGYRFDSPPTVTAIAPRTTSPASGPVAGGAGTDGSAL
jgi:hypothetical protein